MLPQTSPPRAVLFDLDGTLYHQPPLRRRMLLELAKLPLTNSPAKSAKTLRILRMFREVREELRELEPGAGLKLLQYREPATRLGLASPDVQRVVGEWIYRRPLPFLRNYVRADAATFLDRLHEQGVVTGVLSDYPAKDKLAALGLAHRMSAHWCSTDPEIDVFKPHAQGLLFACERLGVAPSEVLYVGDRADVDGQGAHAAGMRFAMIGANGPVPVGETEEPAFPTFAALGEAVFGALV